MVIGKILILSAFLLSSICDASRIKPPLENEKENRCNGEGLSQQECDEDRQDAINSKCITQGELETLIGYNGCPVCKKGKYKTWCPVGCFVRGTKILVFDSLTAKQSWMPIEDIVHQSKRFKIASLHKNASLNELTYTYLDIRLTTQGNELKPLVLVTTDRGTLGITSTHGLTLANGRLIAAEDLVVGDELLSQEGSELVLSIERSMTDDLVFNLSVEADDPQSHLIFAERGIVVGDQFLQSSKYLNSTILK